MFNLVPEIQEKNRRGNIAGGGGRLSISLTD